MGNLMINYDFICWRRKPTHEFDKVHTIEVPDGWFSRNVEPDPRDEDLDWIESEITGPWGTLMIIGGHKSGHALHLICFINEEDAVAFKIRFGYK